MKKIILSLTVLATTTLAFAQNTKDKVHPGEEPIPVQVEKTKPTGALVFETCETASGQKLKPTDKDYEGCVVKKSTEKSEKPSTSKPTAPTKKATSTH